MTRSTPSPVGWAAGACLVDETCAQIARRQRRMLEDGRQPGEAEVRPERVVGP